jgi:hypothetical protein
MMLYMQIRKKILVIFSLIIFLFLSVTSGAQQNTSRTNRYIFLPKQSKLVQTGGIAGVNRTYIVQGQFALTIDSQAAAASFAQVDANAVDDSQFQRTLDPNEVFAMTLLAGTVLNDTTVKFTGLAADGSKVSITATLQDDLVQLVAETVPPPNSADFFTFTMNTIAQRKYAGGTGEPNQPYQISTAEQMNHIGSDPNDWDKHFKLITDIDLAQYTGTQFNIIKLFTGVFDGNCHTVLNFTYTSNNETYVGIFGSIENGVVKDLILNCPNINLPWRFIGSLAGYLSSSKIENCHVLGGSVSGINFVGGLAGGTYDSEISNSSFQGSVYGGSGVGGLVGSAQAGPDTERGNIIKCYFMGEVSGSSGVGGLVGSSFRAKVIDCNVIANVSGKNIVGGLIGKQQVGEAKKCITSGSVSGIDEVGGLCGSNNGFIESCYTTADISGVQDVGGFTGQNGVNYGDVIFPGYIYDSYSRGNVAGQENVGGFVGYNDYFGTIYNCYSDGRVSGTTETGGLVGKNSNGDVINSFWDIQTSGWETSAGGVGKTTAQMLDPNTFITARWDLVGEIRNGTHEIWQMPEEGGSPVLAILNGYTLPLLKGMGTPEDPYLISDVMELGAIINYSRFAHYRLTNSIDLSDINWSVAVIAPNSNRYAFGGFFDGNGYTISNLSINGERYLGLFGIIGEGAEVRNLGVVDVNIIGSNEYIGGLSGANYGTLIQCYSSGIISGTARFVGGLVGDNRGDVIQCYSTCEVSSIVSYKGGLVGSSYGTIVHCYSTGLVTGSPRGYAGGLVGSGFDSNIDHSFWDIETSGQTISAGGAGRTTAQMQSADTFLDAGWDFIGETVNGPNDIWWILDGRDYPRLWWQLPEDNFNDGKVGPLWFEYEMAPDVTWLREINGRLQVYTSGQTEDVDAFYVCNGWRLDTTKPFAISIDFHFSKVGIGNGRLTLGLFPTLDQPLDKWAELEAGNFDNEPFYLYEVRNGEWVEEKVVERFLNDGILYISYDPISDELYFSEIGYGKQKAIWTVKGLIHEGWHSDSLYLTIGGGSQDGITLSGNDAWLDNFKIDDGAILQ